MFTAGWMIPQCKSHHCRAEGSLDIHHCRNELKYGGYIPKCHAAILASLNLECTVLSEKESENEGKMCEALVLPADTDN
jgi:hypothetical protein